ncbi:MAG: radical protein, partial [Candidatus Aminicenantes bacterium]|nr:radical protein [Candidatus Aminicenantes bacterium]
RSPKVVPGDLGPAVALLERAGYARGELHVYLIVGLPGQGAAAVREAVLRVRETGLVPRLAHFSPIPGTGDWQRLVDAGILDGAADPLLHNKTVGPYFWGSLSPEEIAGVRELMVL